MIFRSISKPKDTFTSVFVLSVILSLASTNIAEEKTSSRSYFGLKSTFLSISPSYAFNKRKTGVLTLHGYVPGSTSMFIKKIQKEIEIESLDSFVIIRETVLNDDIHPPFILTFEQFMNSFQEEKLTSHWQEYMIAQLMQKQSDKKGGRGITLDIPVKIKSRAFQKIFGSGTVGLNVSGNISIRAGLRRENRSEVKSILNQGANTNFKMEQKQRFTVTGKIGDKVTVNVDQDSERAFDFENNVRLNYQGYEDDIIQKIEAGNIALSLPGTRYVTFSGKNSGLFGIKSQMVLGNLNVTTIASQEKGESKRISLTGGAEKEPKRIRDYQYLRNTYFFLDTLYRSNYRKFDAEGNHFASSSPIKEIEVYKAAAGYETQYPDENIRAWATYNAVVDTAARPGVADVGHFIRLEKDEYYFEPNLGFIRLNNTISKDEILAVTYKTFDGKSFGDTVNNTIIFKLIKPKNPQPSDLTWNLEWKHVYSLGGRNIEREGFDVKIFFDPPSGPNEETDDTGTKWVDIFGLDNKDQDGTPNSPDGEIDLDPTIVDFTLGELHFPDLKPFDPKGYFRGDLTTPIDRLPGDKRTRAIYDTTVQSVINQQSKFIIEVTTLNRSSDFNLGFNVIEGSEVITLDGQELQNGRDYTIDYFTGRLTILDERATNPASQLDISYERNQLFQLEKKTILGMRAEYDLGRNSYLGGTFLYLNESTLDRKVRVGRGPIRNLVWDLNTRLNFNPNFIGKAFDILPLIRAKGETSLDFEGEIAQVLPTPNTLNSPKTGDKHGVGYIDDFEGAKKTVSLGVLRRNWTRASQPDTSAHSYKNMINYIWYNPIQQVSIKEIYPEREVNPNVPNRVHVLTLQLIPDPNNLDTFNSDKPNPDSWGGVMRALSPGIFDQSQTKFIEVMVKGDIGRLHIDLGSITEDVIPNGKLDTEDKRVGGFRNGILDVEDGEDVGIDGIAKPDPDELNHRRDDPQFVNKHINDPDLLFDFWDIDKDSVKDADEPWSYDDWFYLERSTAYVQEDGSGSIIGTQNNANDEGGRRPDTEDINGNGILDRANSYYSFSFSLDPNHEDASLIVGGNPLAGWKLYRIPFDTGNDSLKVGSPNPTQIEYARIWVDELEDFNKTNVYIAEINLVGSDWKELGVTSDEFTLSDLKLVGDSLAVTQVNTHENVDYAASLKDIGVEGEEDKVTGVRAREQSLVLSAIELDDRSGQNVGIAQKSLFQGENYIRYEKIKMFVYGRPQTPNDEEHIPSDTSSFKPSQLEYFLRFGADKNNYYEYRSKIYEKWHSQNHMDIELQEFTRLDTTTQDSLGNPFKNLGNGKSIRKVGNPSLTNVKTLILGIKNLHPSKKFTGEVWFNELRLSDIERDKGMAMRFRGNMKIANFATVNAEIERKDADFHNVAQRFGTGNNTLSKSINTSVKLENFFPQSWGISMPLNLNYRSSTATPKYFPGKDRLVTNDLSADSLEFVQSVRSQSGFNVSFRRQLKSKNFFLKNTVDNLSFSLGRSQSEVRSPTIKKSQNRSWTGNLDYRIEFGRNNYFTPLRWLPNLPLIGKLKGTKFYYTPQNIAARVNGTKTNQVSQNRIQDITKQDSVKINETETFNLDRSLRTNMKIFENLSVDISRAYKADMRGHTLTDFFKGNFEDINVSQSFSARYNPKIFGWLNNNFTYSSNYTFENNIQQRTTGRRTRVGVTRSGDFTLRLKEFAKSIFGGGKKSSSPSGRRPPGRSRPGKKKEEKEKNEFILYQQEKKEGRSFNPLKLFTGLFSHFKDISVNYTERTNIAKMGLDTTGTPSLAFQFGFSDNTKVKSVANLSTNPLTRSDNRTLRANSGIAFGRAFDVGLTFQHSEQSNQTTTLSGSNSDSWLKLKNFDLPFPEWTVRISGIEKFPMFSKLFKTVSFSHSFSGQRDITWNGEEKKNTQKNTSTNFRPLGKLDLNFNNGITGNIQMNHSVTVSRSLVGGIGARRSTRSDISVTANYSKRSGFRIPIWPFNKKELKNSIDLSVTFTQSRTVTEQSRIQVDGKDKFEEQDKTERWSFSPKLTYSFSTQVRGGAFLEIGQTNSKRSGKTSIQEFGIDINIAIRGK